MDNKPKNGFLTSEFWLIVITAALPILGYVNDHTTGIVAMAVAGVYALARAYVKK